MNLTSENFSYSVFSGARELARKKDELIFPEALSYKGELTKAMIELSRDPLVHFVGYGLRTGRALGTLKDVPEEKLKLGEMSVAEDLMVRVATGMSLKGLKPVVFLERFDFVHNAMDAIVNHLDKFAEISSGEFQPKVILRIVVGNRQKPLFTGQTHVQDYSVMLRAAVNFPIVQLRDASQILPEYRRAYERSVSTALVEYKDLM